MRVHVFSDVHFEHMSGYRYLHFFEKLDELIKKDSAGIAILAGDICEVTSFGNAWVACISEICRRYARVLYVPGNHEYYGTDLIHGNQKIQKALNLNHLKNLVNLDEIERFQVGDQGFVGGTMWFRKTENAQILENHMMDFRRIDNLEVDGYQANSLFCEKYRRVVSKGDVIVTHHLPFQQSVDTQYENSPLNCFFLCDVSNEVLSTPKPKLWIHGHTHCPVDYTHTSGIRVYGNPYGYAEEDANPDFWERMAIDL